MSTALTHKEPSKAIILAAFTAIYIIWGSTYLAIVLAIKSIPPFLMAGTRFFVAGFVLFLWCRLQGQPVPSADSIRKISFSGILMLFLGTGAVVWVEQYLPTGLTAIIVATVPLWFVILDKRQWKFHFSSKWIIAGLLIGFAGVLMLFADKKNISFTGDKMKLVSFFIMIGGSISWAVGSLFSKYKKVEGTPGMKAAIQMMAGGTVSILTGFLTGEQNEFMWSQVSFGSVMALLYLIVMGSLVGFMAYVWLLSVKPPSLVGTYAYVNPVVAVFLGWLFIHEEITRQQILALGIILTGVLLVNFSKK
jgi:drug/metabolite transporter (DMT)-like permease